MKAYAIKDPKGRIVIRSVKSMEETCKQNFINTVKVTDFTYLESIGYHCVPVLITEVKTDK